MVEVVLVVEGEGSETWGVSVDFSLFHPAPQEQVREGYTVVPRVVYMVVATVRKQTQLQQVKFFKRLEFDVCTVSDVTRVGRQDD